MPSESRSPQASAASAKQQGRTIPIEIIKANIISKNYTQQFRRLNRDQLEQHVTIPINALIVAAKAPITGPIVKITGMKMIAAKTIKRLMHKLNFK